MKTFLKALRLEQIYNCWNENCNALGKIFIIIFSVAVSCAIVIQKNTTYVGLAASYTENYIEDMDGLDLLMIVILSFFITLLTGFLITMVQALHKNVILTWLKPLRSDHWLMSHHRLFISSFVALILFWGLFWLAFFPGTAMSDSVRILANPLGLASQHTLTYNLILSGIVNLGIQIGGSNYAGVMLYSFLQMVYSASIVAFCISWMAKRRYPICLILCIQLFFCISTMIASISIVELKDAFFSFTLLLYIPILTEVWRSNGKCLRERKCLYLFLYTSFSTVLVRNNGIYVALIIGIYLLIVYRQSWKRMMLLCLVTVLLPVVLDKTAMGFLTHRTKYTEEAMSVPLQQIAMVAAMDGVMTEEQRAMVETIMPIDEIKARYAPCSTDEIKWGEAGSILNKSFIRNETGIFLRTWAGMLLPNFKAYVKSWLLLTYGYWAFGVSTTTQGFYTDFWAYDGSDMQIEHIRILPENIDEALQAYYKANPGFIPASYLIWAIFFLCLCLLCTRHRGELIIIFLPVLTVWGTLMISAPIATCFRYVWPLYLSLPFLLGITLGQPESETDG